MAFTLVELLVVMAIIAILAALMLPVLARSGSRALETQCMANLRTWGQGFYLYEGDSSGFIPHTDDEGRNSPAFTCDSAHPEHECCYIDLLPPYFGLKSWRGFTNGLKPVEGIWQCPTAKILADSSYGYKPSVVGYHSYAMNSYVEHDFLYGLPYGDSPQPSFLKLDRCASPTKTILMFEQTLNPGQGYGRKGGLDTAGFYTAEDPRALGERHPHQRNNLAGNVLYLDSHVGWRDDLWNTNLTNPRIPKRGDLTWFAYYY